MANHRRLSPEQEREAAARIQAGETVRSIAEAYGIDQQTAHRVGKRAAGTLPGVSSEYLDELNASIQRLTEACEVASPKDLPALERVRLAAIKLREQHRVMAHGAAEGSTERADLAAATRARLERLRDAARPVVAQQPAAETEDESTEDVTVAR